MANRQGGYRKPSDPKAFSGQGAQSQRTDGGPSMAQQPIRPMDAGGVYGERKAMNEMQAGAPMAGDPRPTPAPMPPVTGMFDETEMPNEPVTTGNPLGAGAGPEALNLPNTTPSITSTLRRIAQNDPTGEAEYALLQLSQRGII
jgi:hypothetical protein